MNHPYQSAAYAKAFAYGYEAVHLKEADTHVLLRPIGNTGHVDAMGVYPLCPMNPNADLEKDFAALRARNIVSLVLVSDTFLHPRIERMQAAFDGCKPFKEHFLCNLSKDHAYSKHHRYEVARANKDCQTRIISLAEHLDAWYALYHTLIEKRGIMGIQAFPKSYFADICALEPMTVGAFHEGELISAHIWFRHGNHAYSHLAASNEKGYKLRGSYAVYDFSIAYLREQGVKIIDLGGGAGNEASVGLTFLKKGFSNDSAMCYLNGKILDEEKYAQLSVDKPNTYFPAYRAP